MKINYKTLLSMRFALRLSLVMLTLSALWFYQTQHVDVGLVMSDVGATLKSDITNPTSDITNPTSATPSVLTQKTSIPKAIQPYKVSITRNGSVEDEDEEHEDFEKEQAERAEYSEERERFDFDFLKDPATGKIPRDAPMKAAEAAMRAKVQRSNAINTRAATINVVPRGPNNLGGRTRAIGIDKRNANIMIAGSVSSGVFRTTNGGTSWSRVAPIGQIHNVTAIAQDPRAGQENTWYYGTGEAIGNSAALGSNYNGNGIWKSTDNGITWSPLASTISLIETFSTAFDFVHRIVVDPTTGYVYAAAANTIQRSTDGGATWSLVLGTLVNNRYTDIIVTPSGRLYAGFDGRDAAAAGVWTSTSGASGSWTKIGVPGVTPGWNALNAFGRTVLAYAPSNPDIVFALYFSNIAGTPCIVEAELFKWDNSTSTWTDLSANLPNEAGGCRSGSNPFAVQTGYDLVVAVKPDDVNTVFVAGTNIYRSTSGFTNTTATSHIGGYNSPANYALYPNHHPDIHVLNFAAGDNNTLYSGDDGGIQKADITAANVAWTSLNNNYVTYQYYHADISPVVGSSAIAGGAQDNGTTANTSGSSFSSIFGGDGCQTAIISYASASSFNIIASSQSGNLVRLTGPSLGFTIYPATSGAGIFVTYFQLDQDNTNYLYYADNAAMYRTRNAANLTSTAEGDPATSWQKMTGLGLVGNIRCMATSRDNTYGCLDYTASDPNRKLYFGTTAGRIYRLNDPAFVASTTAAVNITPPTATVNSLCSSIAVNPFDDNEIIATFSNYGVISVFQTFNANSATPTWNAIEGPASGPVALGSARSSIIARIGSTTTYIVGNSTGLYSTQALSGAATVWDQVSPNDINFAVCQYMRLRADDNRIVLATHGNGMYELQLPAFISTNESVAPTDIAGTAAICIGSSTTLTATGGNIGAGGVIEWFTGSCGGTPAGTGASITVSPSNTTTYFVRYKGNCNTTVCISKTVTVSTPSVGGTVSPATKSGCGPTSVTLSVSGLNGTVTRWEQQIECTGVWTAISNSASNPFTVTTPNSSVCYRAIVTNGACPEAISSTATITIDKPAVGGRVTLQSNQTATSFAICPNQNAVLIPLGFTGKVVNWQYSYGTSSIWYDLPGSEGQSTLTVNGSTVTTTTFYRVVICTQLGICTGYKAVAYSSAFRINKNATCSSPDGSITISDSPLTILSAFPNPTKDVFILEIENNIEGSAQVEIMDVAGRIVQRTQQSIEKGFTTITLNVQNLASGLYLVRIKDSDNQEVIVKMSKL